MTDGSSILLTGASGFIGSAVARLLVEEGFSVRALVRSQSRRDHLSALGIEIVEGSINAPAVVAAALARCRYLVHVAADYRLWAPDRSEIFATNVEGTRVVMEQARKAGVERVVYTSSVATVRPRPDGSPADEADFMSEGAASGAYQHSKIMAERLVRDMVEQGLPAVIVNPATVIGPNDARPTPTGRIIIAAATGRIPAFVDTGLNLVHVDDVARGHVAALRRGRIGERYILGGDNVRFARMLAAIAALAGRRPPRLRIPWYAGLPAALVAEAAARVTGREPLATLEGVRHARERMFFSTAKAEKELGIRARPYQAALADALDWFRGAGYLQ
ncbi:MAG: NAD-dependent epimerase/dehydratase family protein [Hyphomicrobiales bacterium]|nr:NAD-dependent epimerase/dehydratase family protein [Hyphomicrobiales bacterium]MBV8827130.1 NAD-dependent epimerase/dehydratase family protein [Hyphomicrobiales bacterium]MBV9426731.1 NAD-dependent epimerase/dehydratase family protein [Bradyrhizobiaceae bacterium]